MKTLNFLTFVCKRTKGYIVKREQYSGNFLLLLLIFMINQSVFAQESIVTGTVVDTETQQPLPGATVLLKGTSNGVSTDFDGKFSLKITSPDAVLVVSYVGYQTKEVQVGNQEKIVINLEIDSSTLDEVVVIGYGTQKKVNLSGAVEVVDMDIIEDRPIANVSQGLQGAVSNLNITFGNGAPGGTANVNIRGITSLNGGSPLILIDGVPSSSSDLTRMNPNDIASISILKDASSAAIYGARAAFGVVLVTTKEGGRNKIQYSNTFIWGTPTVTPKPITDPYIFSRLLDISTSNTPWNYVSYNDDWYAWAKARSEDSSVPSVRLDPNNPNRYQYMGNTNWNDYFFNKYSFSQNHNISISGKRAFGTTNAGDETLIDQGISYYLSASHTLENGLNRLVTDNWERNTLRSKITVEPYAWMDFENNTFLTLSNRKNPRYSLTNVYNLRPTEVVKNPDGSWADNPAGRAAAEMIDGGKQRFKQTGIQTTNRLHFYLLDKDLTITAEHTFKKDFNRYHSDRTNYRVSDGPNSFRDINVTDWAYETQAINTYNVFNIYGTYAKTIGKHYISATTGFNKETSEYNWFSAQRNGLISRDLPYLTLATGDQEVGYNFSDWAVTGLFNRVNYIYNERYIFEVNTRYDGSSRFPKQNRYGFFPGMSAAWLVSKELGENVTDVMNHLKIRYSYGSLGNQSVSNYGYINSLGQGESSYLIDGDYPKIVRGPGLGVDPNNYTWERVTSSNFGVDASFFNNMLSFTFEMFTRDTKDMLVPSKELPAVLGTSPPVQNAADLQTKGWELSFGYKDEFKVGGSPFNLELAARLWDNKTKITRFDNEGQLFSQWREGQDVGEIWGLENDGFFKDEDEIATLDQSAIVPWGAIAVVPGWPKYVDQDGDGKIERGQSAIDPKDLKLIGNSQPRYQFGFNMYAAWKGFDVSCFVQGIGKKDYYPRHYLYWGPYQQPYANVYPHLLDFYRATGDSDALRAQHSQSYIDAGLADANTDAEFPVLQSWLADNNFGAGLDISQTKYMKSAAYLRLKNISIGYSLPHKILDKMKISNLRVFVTGENIAEWSSIKKIVDPEATGNSGYAYPFHRKLSVGMNVTF
ncbi:SusC/RagA family TonB-linked outer membrane protein [Wocania ichthyoenteri]|uniref:SusC/RagA family TonB-linked outer membrane protein n=1 Tax=Wocania ichthyoenteri TaxID=1230531 RepID=UPI0009DFA3E1|nr:TonB-dependent receptor [Wocania ichthyoenteri]